MKITKLNTEQEIFRKIHFYILENKDNFTLESIYNEIVNFCEDGVDVKLVKEILIDCMDNLLEDGLIRYFQKVYYNTLTESVEKSV